MRLTKAQVTTTLGFVFGSSVLEYQVTVVSPALAVVDQGNTDLVMRSAAGGAGSLA